MCSCKFSWFLEKSRPDSLSDSSTEIIELIAQDDDFVITREKINVQKKLFIYIFLKCDAWNMYRKSNFIISTPGKFSKNWAKCHNKNNKTSQIELKGVSLTKNGRNPKVTLATSKMDI